MFNVYGLYLGGKLQYVGQTRLTIADRVRVNAKTYKFDYDEWRCLGFAWSDKCARILERVTIQALGPPHNKYGRMNPKYEIGKYQRIG